MPSVWVCIIFRDGDVMGVYSCRSERQANKQRRRIMLEFVTDNIEIANRLLESKGCDIVVKDMWYHVGSFSFATPQRAQTFLQTLSGLPDGDIVIDNAEELHQAICKHLEIDRKVEVWECETSYESV